MNNKGFLQKFIDKTFFFGLFLGALGFIGFVLLLIKKIKSGEGQETYFTGFGVKFSYLGASILLLVIPVIMLIALVIGWWQKREERDFIKKYSRNSNDENT